MSYALSHHPLIQAQVATIEVRQAQVDAARARYLPDVDVSAQINAGTGNVLRGSLYPMPGIPPISGPPTGREIGDAAFGSLVGLSVRWDAVGWVRQMAQVDAALADLSQERSATDLTRLTIAYGAADQFIDVLSREEMTRAAQANVDRTRVFATTVKVLVDQELRPGADYSRAAAEMALASTLLVQAEQAEAVSRIALARALGSVGLRVETATGRLLEFESAVTPVCTTCNPALVEAEAAVRANQARKHAVELQYLPRVELAAALSVRGSGLTSGPLSPSPALGLAPDTPNWATGVVITWPALEWIVVNARVRVEAAQVKVANARRADVLQAVQSQIDSARETLVASRRVAENTPIALESAREAERQAQARYHAGLASVDLVAESQRLLTQAEMDDAVARLNVRRAELLLARAIGDLSPFLDQIRGGR